MPCNPHRCRSHRNKLYMGFHKRRMIQTSPRAAICFLGRTMSVYHSGRKHPPCIHECDAKALPVRLHFLCHLLFAHCRRHFHPLLRSNTDKICLVAGGEEVCNLHIMALCKTASCKTSLFWRALPYSLKLFGNTSVLQARRIAFSLMLTAIHATAVPVGIVCLLLALQQHSIVEQVQQ